MVHNVPWVMLQKAQLLWSPAQRFWDAALLHATHTTCQDVGGSAAIPADYLLALGHQRLPVAFHVVRTVAVEPEPALSPARATDEPGVTTVAGIVTVTRRKTCTVASWGPA